MSEEEKTILGVMTGFDLILSPEHYEKYKGNINKQLVEKDKKIERLTKRLEEAQLAYLAVEEKNKKLHSIIKEVRDNLENSIKSINEKLKNNKEPFEVIDGKIQYINDYRVVRLKAFRTKCKELLEILDKAGDEK